jgi:hypothetical protein
MNEDIFKSIYSVLKQYIPAKDLQQATDHLVDDAQEFLEEDELYRLAGLDKHMKASVSEIIGEPDFDHEDEDLDY